MPKCSVNIPELANPTSSYQSMNESAQLELVLFIFFIFLDKGTEASGRFAIPMTSPDIADMLEKSKELDRLRKEQEDVLLEINKMHKKLQATPETVEKPGDNSLSKLKMLYTQAKELSESEMSISNQLLSQLDAIAPAGGAGQQRRRLEGNEQKKKRMKGDPDIPRLTPSMRNQQEFFANLKGEQVAARVAQEDGEKDEWVIVKVIHYDKESKEFEVLDEEPGDDEEGGCQRKYKLPWSHIIPFPKISDLATTPEFPPGKQVLAVYPGTTALYKATVVNARKNIISIEELIGFRLTFACDGPNGISISRGRPTTTHWSLMMTKKMGLYLNAWSPLTGLSLFQMDITNEI
ncbi:hypothetical protein T459_07086 [Capsicum annuum]|uniref:SGF29 C-terminal domain-containing protein n=1 Tax=Capsicum annuum TaxID=4072 RepID=A0A2G3ACR8_CAPAN|nr:putative SAGA-associated factor 29-like isoform X2 [Capsicum annuum]PHT91973.1 hypothetical protein T459_07086 [Capsicum annuum]